MKKTIIAGLVITGMVAGMSSAQAVTPKEAKYLKIVKAAKFGNLKKNTNTELINIGQTMCLDMVYTREGLAQIYKDNHYKWDSKTIVAFGEIAREYLCPKKITIMNDDGSWTEVKIYDGNPQVTWVEAN